MMGDKVKDEPQRWTAKRRVALVSILKGETSAQEAARNHGLTVAEVEDWKERFLVGAENALRARPKDEEALKDECGGCWNSRQHRGAGPSRIP